VRKELKATNPENSNDFERECRVLSFLNCLDHPNIIELLGSYTYCGVHSLIFPVAEYDLRKLLQNEKPSNFQFEHDYLFALCGLVFALKKLHYFSYEELEVELIGCHHDLRPHNILIQDSKFLLADFGLSNLKEITEGSNTPWKKGDNRYLAPECEDAERGFQPGKVGRKSDIWSLGCILAELVTYMMEGREGVSNFEKARKVTLAGTLIVCTFHAGRDPNKGLEAWLARLKKEASPAVSGLIGLVHEMLHIDPDDRPSAHQVTQRLRCLALKSKFDDVDNFFDAMVAERTQLDLLVERDRFALWVDIMGLSNPTMPGSMVQPALTADDAFVRNFENLSSIGAEAILRIEPQEDFHARVVRLRIINDGLIQALPHNLQIIINRRLEQKLVSTDDLDRLTEVRETFDEKSQHRAIGTLAAVRQMYRLYEKPRDGHGRRMQLHSESWISQKSFDHFEIGELRAEGKPPIRTLVERIKYDERWVNAVGDELFNRIGAVTELLRTCSRLDKDMRLLSPIGYFHEPHNRAFVLAHHLPGQSEAPEGRRPEIYTLRKYMETTEKKRPALEARLLLAKRLASALARIHKVKWLHKNISSFSIVFSLPQSSSFPTNFPPPHIIGFNYSRPDDPNSFSYKLELEVADYCHPEYLKKRDRIRYKAEFDYYSLGLVLLEVGMWRTLSSLTKGKERLRPEELSDYIMQRYIPQLDFYVGKTYRKLVERCLKGEIKSEIPDEGYIATESASYDFLQTVEEHLASFSL